MDVRNIANKIIDLKNADLQLRSKLVQNGQLGKGYHPDMEKLHIENAEKLNDIIQTIGFPTIDKVGEEASEAAWLIIQHSIGNPGFMKKCEELLKIAVSENKANPRNLAYLSDRIAVSEGKLQLYGTQFDWDENGELSPDKYDDLIKVNERRKSIGWNTLEEQTAIIRNQAADENQAPPEDFAKRKKEVEEWRQKAGWLK